MHARTRQKTKTQCSTEVKERQRESSTWVKICQDRRGGQTEREEGIEREMKFLSLIFTACWTERASVLLPCSNTPHGCLLPATTMLSHTPQPS